MYSILSTLDSSSSPFDTSLPYYEKHHSASHSLGRQHPTEADDYTHEEEGIIFEVDLMAFEEQNRDKIPIYTRDLLQKLANVRAGLEGKLRGNGRKPEDIDHLMLPDINGEMRVAWENPERIGDYDPEDYRVQVNYLNYVELSPKYKPEFNTENVRELKFINRRCLPGKDSAHVPLPAYLVSFPTSAPKTDAPSFEEWDREITRARKHWDASIAKEMLEEQFKATAKDSVQIKKIVCFGLGCLERGQGKWDRQCILQYFAAFTIAEILNEIYQAQDPDTPKIKIFFQEVHYPKLDKDIWRKHAYEPSFPVMDPNGFLAIDSHTLVIAPHIPICVPVLQICADIVEGGPAGFIVDKTGELNPKQREFCVWDRVSPRVIKILSKFQKMDFDDHKIEHEIRKSIFEQMGQYWLWDMTGWWKPKGA